MATTWQEYQEEVSAFFRSLGLDATTNHSVQGVRTSHDIDVYVRSHHVGFDVVWIVECKHWSTPVTKLHVLALREIVTDLGADRGVLLCETGFQSGALEAATLTNVHATSLSALRGTASAELTAMRLRELFDRAESCGVRYWNIPKGARIEAGLRPGGGSGYSGRVLGSRAGTERVQAAVMTRVNRYFRFSKLSEAKFRQLLRCFALDLTATQTSVLTGISVRSVNAIFLRIRRKVVEECERKSPFQGVQCEGMVSQLLG
jgi:restriction system protein